MYQFCHELVLTLHKSLQQKLWNLSYKNKTKNEKNLETKAAQLMPTPQDLRILAFPLAQSKHLSSAL